MAVASMVPPKKSKETFFSYSVRRQRMRFDDGDLLIMEGIFHSVMMLIPVYRRLYGAYLNAIDVIAEKERKLASADAQVSELSNANLQWMKLAKERKDKLRKHGLLDEKNIKFPCESR